MSITSPASQALTESGIPHQQFIHAGPVISLEQAATERNQDVSQIVRSIVFRLSQGNYAMALVAGTRQVSWKALRRHFNQSRLTMASPDEVKAVTGFEIGAVSPFGLPQPIPILVDESVLAQPAISMGSGMPGVAILITTRDLLKALGEIQIGKFT